MISPAPSQLIPVMYRWCGDANATSFAEVAAAICHASNVDPIFRGEALGPAATACILMAEAFERSRFEKHMFRENGRRLGVLQLMRPSHPRMNVDDMIRPRKNCLLGVDLMRVSFDKCRALRWEFRLAWLLRLGKPGGSTWNDPPLDPKKPGDLDTLGKSMVSLQRAKKLFGELYAKKASVEGDAFDGILALPAAVGGSST